MKTTAWTRCAFALAVLLGAGFALAADEPAAAPAASAAAASTVLITGTNRGIGLEFARQYAERGWKVIATVRDPAQATELQAIAARHPNLTIEQLDVANNDSIAALALKYKGQPIDVLLNNAGFLGDPDKQAAGKALDYDTFQQVLRVNTYAPLLMSQAFLDNVVASQQKKIIAITSGIGSITGASRFGGLAFYRISKAGLNMGMRTLQAELRSKGVKIGILAPGEVETRMLRQSGYSGHGMDAPESVTALIRNIDAVNDQEAKFVMYNGTVAPW